MRSHVFICHASQDVESASELCKVIEDNGIPCWIASRNVSVAANWAVEISNAIESARVVIVLISNSANVSKYVSREVGISDKNDIPIIPLRIEDVKPGKPLQLFLQNIEWFDIFPGPIETHWRDIGAALNRIHSKDVSSTIKSEPEQQPPPDTILDTVGNKVKKTKQRLAIALLVSAPSAFIAIIVQGPDTIDKWSNTIKNLCKNYNLPFCSPGPPIEPGRAAEKLKFESAGNDAPLLQDYIDSCVICEFKDNAKYRLNKIVSDKADVEIKNISAAGFDISKLRELKISVTSKAAQSEVDKKIKIYESNRNAFDASRGNIGKLLSYIGEFNPAIFKAQAETEIRNIQNASAINENKRLDDVKFNPVLLATLALNATTPAVISEVKRRLSVIESERKSYEAAQGSQTKIDSLRRSCEACLFPEASLRNVTGYVVLAVLNKENVVTRTLFERDSGKIQFVEPGEIVTVANSSGGAVDVRREPFRYSPEQFMTVASGPAIGEIVNGTKVRIVGNSFISFDKSYKYVIAPIETSLTQQALSDQPVFNPVTKISDMSGYVYFGSLEESNPDGIKFPNSNFIGESSNPSVSTFPAPNTVWVAQRKMNLRSSPFIWDRKNAKYNSSTILSEGVDQGSRVRILGDGIITDKGRGIWFPVRIEQ